MCIALAILAASPVLAHAGRYELIPEPDVRQSSTNRVASADVIDKKASRFWICTARYNFQDLTANNGDCVRLSPDIGRPSLTETSDVRVVTGDHSYQRFSSGILVHRTLPAVRFSFAVLWRKRHKQFEQTTAIFGGCPTPRYSRNRRSIPSANWIAS
jgi:hypothetical protein